MSQINGVVCGVVTDTNPEGQVKVHFPWLDDNHQSDWIRVATTMAGNNKGSFMMPEVNDEVLVAFDHGDARFPYVVGFMWNGVDATPAADVRDRIIRSKNGHKIRFLDSTPNNGDMGALIIEDAHGNRITLSNGKITIYSKAVLELRAEGAITLNGPGWTRVVSPISNPI